jgi:hypothetical protein
MFKRLLLISLIALIPVQAWAVLDMSMQKQLATPVEKGQEQVLFHPCHQEANTADQHSMNDHKVIEVSGDRCYSCTLCMAFGLLPNSVGLLVADRYSQTFHTTLKTLMGIDSSVVIKPPIL